MAIKMVATDIDGTILRYGCTEFTPEVVECIKELDASGIKVVIVTGRMHKSAKKIADKLGLKTPIVSYQGALVKENTEEQKALYERYIDNNIAHDILNWAKENKVYTNLYLDDYLHIEEENEFSAKYTGEQNIPYNLVNFDETNIDKVNKILLIDYSNAERVTGWKNYLTEKYPELYIVKSTNYFCEICHPEATKGDGIRFLESYYGITKDEILTIGDHDNDLELILAGGVGVAMGNATEGLKKVATYITDTVDNNGFVKAIDKFVKRGANV